MTTTNSTSDEREERLLQELVGTPAGERIRMKCGAADLRSVITDILSLLDSEAADPDPDEATLPEADNNLLWINPVAGAVAHYKAGAAFLPYRLVREDGDDG